MGVAIGAVETGAAGAGRGVDGEERSDGWSAMKRRLTTEEKRGTRRAREASMLETDVVVVEVSRGDCVSARQLRTKKLVVAQFHHGHQKHGPLTRVSVYQTRMRLPCSALPCSALPCSAHTDTSHH